MCSSDLTVKMSGKLLLIALKQQPLAALTSGAVQTVSRLDACLPDCQPSRWSASGPCRSTISFNAFKYTSSICSARALRQHVVLIEGTAEADSFWDSIMCGIRHGSTWPKATREHKILGRHCSPTAQVTSDRDNCGSSVLTMIMRIKIAMLNCEQSTSAIQKAFILKLCVLPRRHGFGGSP